MAHQAIAFWLVTYVLDGFLVYFEKMVKEP